MVFSIYEVVRSADICLVGLLRSLFFIGESNILRPDSRYYDAFKTYHFVYACFTLDLSLSE